MSSGPDAGPPSLHSGPSPIAETHRVFEEALEGVEMVLVGQVRTRAVFNLPPEYKHVYLDAVDHAGHKLSSATSQVLCMDACVMRMSMHVASHAVCAVMSLSATAVQPSWLAGPARVHERHVCSSGALRTVTWPAFRRMARRC